MLDASFHVATQETLAKNQEDLQKEIKEDVVLVLGRKLDDKVDIMHKKQKKLDDKMCAMTQNISSMAQNLSIITQNQNNTMECYKN